MKILYAFLAIFAVLFSTWVYKLGWGKPARFNHFVERAMIQMALPDPELLSNLGLVDNTAFDFFSNKLTDISYIKNIENQKRVQNLLSVLHQYERNKLDSQEQLTYDILEYFLSAYLKCVSFGYGSYENVTNAFNPYPVNQIFGIQNILPDFMTNMHRVINKKSAERYVARLNQWEIKFSDLIEELALRETNGVVLPQWIIEKVLAESKLFIDELPNENMLFTLFRKKLDKLYLSKSHRARIEKDAIEAIKTKVYPAYRELIAFLEDQRLRATEEAGVWKFPNGDAYYQQALRYHITTEDTPETVHSLGLVEVERIQNEMRQILDRLRIPGWTIGEAMQNLAEDPHFLYPDSEEGRSEILADFHGIFDRMQEKLSELFTHLPKAKLQVEAVPDFKASTAPIAYYEPGDLKGVRPGVFYVNTYNMKSRTKFTMPTLAYHEGLPGHHLQIARAQEIPNLPTFRKVVTFNAYVEGWALYCEQLASEYGLISSPYDELGRLQFELMRAVRLVVDTGIHYKRWSRNQAIQYMSDTTGQNEDEVASEIDRYIVLPGQACSYKIGMIKLLELRKKMKERLGPRFNIKDFHEVILKNGAMPLSILEAYLDHSLRAETGPPTNIYTQMN